MIEAGWSRCRLDISASADHAITDQATHAHTTDAERHTTCIEPTLYPAICYPGTHVRPCPPSLGSIPFGRI